MQICTRWLSICEKKRKKTKRKILRPTATGIEQVHNSFFDASTFSFFLLFFYLKWRFIALTAILIQIYIHTSYGYFRIVWFWHWNYYVQSRARKWECLQLPFPSQQIMWTRILARSVVIHGPASTQQRNRCLFSFFLSLIFFYSSVWKRNTSI